MIMGEAKLSPPKLFLYKIHLKTKMKLSNNFVRIKQK